MTSGIGAGFSFSGQEPAIRKNIGKMNKKSWRHMMKHYRRINLKPGNWGEGFD
jgi:hypothetical protein